ncbi:MAG: hypothetical protein GY729_03685 [Desulfobacteraceae bacterium]|nr:hypothetical protein [Desulfobacteraceae bacterium]
MPKITIKTLPLDSGIDIQHILKTLGHQLSHSLDIGLDRLIILWEIIGANQFLFHGKVTDVQPEKTHHPIVEITAVQGMPRSLEEKMVETIAQTLSNELLVDFNNICVSINTLAPGKLFVVGRFVKGSAAKKARKTHL